MNIGNWSAWEPLGSWHAWWSIIEGAANSNFAVAFVGSLAGAAGGAFAVYTIGDRAKARDQLLGEIRAVISSLEILLGICNVLFNVKEQYVIDMKRDYEERLSRAQKHYLLTITKQIPAGTPLVLGQMDAHLFDPPRIRVDALEKLLLENMSIRGKAVPLFTVLTQSIETMNRLIAARNQLINDLKPTPLSKQIPLLFGLPVNGNIDNTYGNYITGIASSVNDCLFFGTSLVEELKKYGESIRKRYKKRFRGVVPGIPDLRFRIAEQGGLMPSANDYPSWQSMFVAKIPETRGRRLGKIRYVLRREWRTLRDVLWSRLKSRVRLCQQTVDRMHRT